MSIFKVFEYINDISTDILHHAYIASQNRKKESVDKIEQLIDSCMGIVAAPCNGVHRSPLGAVN